MKKIILLNLVVLLVAAASATAATRLVPDEYATIQDAIDAAVDGDVVIVAPGTYTGDGNRDIDFRGKTITVRSTDPNDPNIVAATIINCSGTRPDPHRGFYFHSGEDANSVVEGFTITDGHGFVEPDYHNWSLGGGIYCVGSGPTIANCVIRGNSATQGGGIFVWKDSSPTIINCTISGNSSGVYCWRNSSLDIEDSIISGTGWRGIYCWDSPAVNIVNCTITNNYCAGIAASGYGSLIISNCIISDNHDPGIHCSVRRTGTATISNCIISGNMGNWHGGGIRISTDDQGLATITNCTITGNSAIDSFGNIGRGGGVSCSRGNIIIANSIIWNNIGEDIYVWNYPPPPCQDCTVEPTEVAVSYSCTGQIIVEEDPVFGDPNLILGAGNIDADPCFVRPGYWDANGVWIDGDYHLLEDSPCIDAGDPNYIAEPNEIDLDGRPRVIGGRIDMGAYEYRPPIPAEVRIVPRTINLASKGNWITCYIWLPEDYDVADIDPNNVLLEYEIQPESLRLDEQQQVAIAKFNRSDIQEILNPPMAEQVELIITGQLTDGTVFEGTDVIRAINKAGKN